MSTLFNCCCVAVPRSAAEWSRVIFSLLSQCVSGSCVNVGEPPYHHHHHHHHHHFIIGRLLYTERIETDSRSTILLRLHLPLLHRLYSSKRGNSLVFTFLSIPH